ncbi:hypothetical protein CAOG_010159 [Capsaspora owczarzaki ATCC 30864]|uniref:Uncharacterized protein n=1 Tax=Capsaspora owczarzaki (strain ATCC 30864) TaxID=595528 RepID=A0A0D2WY86_CAPO3|nr:hypothetical protein CAOG_010159 [Capsaspora owczarzaki ATCC 30864]
MLSTARVGVEIGRVQAQKKKIKKTHTERGKKPLGTNNGTARTVEERVRCVCGLSFEVCGLLPISHHKHEGRGEGETHAQCDVSVVGRKSLTKVQNHKSQQQTTRKK